MLKVLIVDDEAPIRKWLAFCIEQCEGFVVSGQAKNGFQGIELVRQTNPDIILTDIEMPGMSGIDMIRQLDVAHMPYVIVLTSYENFNYVRDAFTYGSAEYILKTEMSQDMLQKALSKAQEKIRKKICEHEGQDNANAQLVLRQLILDGIPVHANAEWFGRHGIALEDTFALAADVWCENISKFQGIQRQLAQDPALFHVRFAPIGNDHFIVVANTGSEHGVYELVRRCEKAVSRYAVSMGISDVMPHLGRLREAVAQAQARCSQGFYRAKGGVFWDNSVATEPLQSIEYWRISFSKELYQQHFTQALAVKDEVLNIIRRDCPADVASVKALCVFLTRTLLHFTMDASQGLEQRVEQVERTIQDSIQVQEVLRAVDEVFQPFTQRVYQHKSYSEPVEKVVSFIHAHYAEKISLAHAAAVVSFSPEHLSRLFTKETGVNFVAYLNNVRMKHAIELLEQSDYKIYEIAERVGYASIGYFSTVFKKNFGQTPNEYQSQNLHARPRKE